VTERQTETVCVCDRSPSRFCEGVKSLVEKQHAHQAKQRGDDVREREGEKERKTKPSSAVTIHLFQMANRVRETFRDRQFSQDILAFYSLLLMFLFSPLFVLFLFFLP
jgi:hypothetical protein